MDPSNPAEPHGPHESALRRLEAEAGARRTALAEALERLRQERGQESADDEHDPEGPTTSAEWSRLAGLEREAAAEAEAIARALRRVADGTGGLCTRCGREIAPARLEARPTAELCIDCARDGERR